MDILLFETSDMIVMTVHETSDGLQILTINFRD